MNYSEKSDREIDVEVAKKLGINWYLRPSDDRNNVGIWVYGENDDGKTAIELPNYCNSWADICPISFDHKITIEYAYSHMPRAWHETMFGEIIQYSDDNTCRAQAIVFLMIEVE